MVKFKQRCYVCKNNWALVSSGRQKFVVCKDCEMKVVDKKVEKKTYAKLFDIPREWYEENGFLRSIRYSYVKFCSLTEMQL